MITIGSPFTIPELAEQDDELVPVRFQCLACKKYIRSNMLADVVLDLAAEPLACVKCNPKGWLDMMIVVAEAGQTIPNLCIVEVKQSSLC